MSPSCRLFGAATAAASAAAEDIAEVDREMRVSTLDVTVFSIDDDDAAFGPESCVVVFT